MNDLLQLKGIFEQAKSNNKPQAPKLPSGEFIEVTASKLEKLKIDLLNLKKFWLEQQLFKGALISVYYNKLAAKSNRIQGLMSKGSKTANSFVVGARFTNNESPKHIITYYVSMEILEESISRINKSIQILNEKFNGKITNDLLENIDLKQIDFLKYEFVKTNFQNTIG